jgi:hypothetical protein
MHSIACGTGNPQVPAGCARLDVHEAEGLAESARGRRA